MSNLSAKEGEHRTIEAAGVAALRHNAEGHQRHVFATAIDTLDERIARRGEFAVAIGCTHVPGRCPESISWRLYGELCPLIFLWLNDYTRTRRQSANLLMNLARAGLICRQIPNDNVR
jgi:hypothetical protein